MYKVDPILTYVYIGVYVGFTTLMMLNIYIAWLTCTFNKIHDSSRAYFILQRATVILGVESRFEEKERYYKYLGLRKKYADTKSSFLDGKPSSSSSSSSSDDQMKPVKETLKQVEHEINALNEDLDTFQHQTVTLFFFLICYYVLVLKQTNNLTFRRESY